MLMPKKSLVAAAGAATATVLAFSPSAAAAVSDPTLVALGDSYSAGNGAGAYLSDGTDCHRSSRAYPSLIAQNNGLNLRLEACSGAVTNDLPSQYGALSADTDYVTITIGGNDVGFAKTIQECMKPSWWGDCSGTVNEGLSIARNQLPTRLANAYAEIKARAPQARVTVAGYPRLFNGRDCSLITFFSREEMDSINAGVDEVNQIIRTQAQQAGFAYADVRPAFDGHAVCDSPEWIHNANVVYWESFHPKAEGHQAYAGVVSPLLVGQTRLAGTQSTDSRAALSTSLTADLRATGDQKTTKKKGSIRAGGKTSSDTTRGQVRKPDLRSQDAKRAGRAVGFSDAELATLADSYDKALSGKSLSSEEKELLQRAE